MVDLGQFDLGQFYLGQFDLGQFWVSTFFLDDLGQFDLGQLAQIVDFVCVLCVSAVCCVMCDVCAMCVMCAMCVKTPAALGPPGLHTTARELQTCTFQGPGASNTTKIPRKDPQEREKKNENEGGRGKKSAKFWAPHPSGPHHSGPQNSGPQNSRPHPCMNCVCPPRKMGGWVGGWG